MNESEIVEAFARHAVELVSHVPDSWLTSVLAELDARPGPKVVRATREEEAVAICCGAALAGRRSVALMQNAGLLSAGNVILTVAASYATPIVLLVVHRGNPRDPSRYQVRKGQATEAALQAFGIPYSTPDPAAGWDSTIGDALSYAEAWAGPYALLVDQRHLEAQ